MPITYPLDLTGVSIANKITNENHVFVNPEDRLFVLDASPFFTQGLQIRRQPSNQLLQPGTHFKALWLVQDAVMQSGKEVCSVIYITDETVNEVNITYQTIGGVYTNNMAAIQQAIDALSLPDANEVAWGQIIDIPAQFDPVEHLHHTRDLFGLQELTAQLEAIRMAIINDGSNGVIGAIFQYIDQKIESDTASPQDITDVLTAITQAIATHMTDNSAHTKDKVGLGSVENYAKATDMQAYTGNSDTVYATAASAAKAALGQMRHIGGVNGVDPNALEKPFAICAHDNCPTGSAGNLAGHQFMVLTTFRPASSGSANASADVKHQIAFGSWNTSGIWSRRYGVPTWQAWQRIDKATPTSLTTENLDTLLTSGDYVQFTPANATAGRNYPRLTVQCQIDVQEIGSGQVIQTVRSFNASPFSEHSRRYVSGVWGAWTDNLTKDTVGLGQLGNYPFPTDGEAYQGSSQVNYMNPKQSKLTAKGVLRHVGSTNINPSTTLEAFIISNHANVPDGVNLFSVWTYFNPTNATDVNATTTPRYQVARQLTSDASEVTNEFHRYHDGSVWTAWRRMMAVNTTDGATRRFNVSSTAPNNSPNTCLLPYFRFEIAIAGEGGTGLPVGQWYIQNYFDSEGNRQTSSHYRTQIAFPNTNFETQKNRLYIRRYNGSTWNRWMRLDSNGGEELSGTDNLNDIVIDGWYTMRSGLASTALNYPTTSNGNLFVIDTPTSTGQNAGIRQTYYSNDNYGIWTRRALDATTWEPWVQIQEKVLDPYKDHPFVQALRRARMCHPMGMNYTSVFETIPGGTIPTTGEYYSPGVLAPDGKIYSVKTNMQYGGGGSFIYVRAYDPIAETFTILTSNQGEPANLNTQFFGGVIASSTGRIYFYPSHITINEQGVIVWYDTLTGQWGNINIAAHLSMVRGWSSATQCATNHHIYFAPYHGHDVLRINPLNNTITYHPITPTPSWTSFAYWGCQLGIDDKIYCMPHSAPSILVIDPRDAGNVTCTEMTFGLTLTGNSKYAGAVHGSDGKIYGVPYDADTLLVVDPLLSTAKQVVNVNINSDSAKWVGGCQGPDGRIYMAPYTGAGLLTIDTLTNGTYQMYVQYGVEFGVAPLAQGIIQAPNGKLVFSNGNINQFYTLEPAKAVPFGLDLLFSPYLNKSI